MNVSTTIDDITFVENAFFFLQIASTENFRTYIVPKNGLFDSVISIQQTQAGRMHKVARRSEGLRAAYIPHHLICLGTRQSV